MTNYKLLSADEFRQLAQQDNNPQEVAVYRAVADQPIQVGNSRTFRFCFSDGDVDLAGDTLNPKGWYLDDYLENPIALWSHDTQQPIGRASNLAVEGNRLFGDIEFMPAEVSAFADEIFRMVQAGYIRAVSVGFLPIEYEFSKDKDRPHGIDYAEQRLLEISLCAVPCNPRALISDAKSKGIETPELSAWFADLLAWSDSIKSSKPTKTTKGLNNQNSLEDGLMSLSATLKQVEKELGRIKKIKLNRKDDPDMVDESEDEDNTSDTEHELCLRAAHAHLKACKDLHDAADDHHEEAMKCIQRALESGEEPDEEEDKDEDTTDDNHDDDDAEKAISRIRARVNTSGHK